MTTEGVGEDYRLRRGGGFPLPKIPVFALQSLTPNP